MTKLADKVKLALDEARTLILVVEILLGFEYRGVFEQLFQQLPRASQYLKLGGLTCELVAFALLVAPAAYHHIVSDGEDSEALNRFACVAVSLALLPFAVSFGIDLYLGTIFVAGQAVAILTGASAALVALVFWYGIEFAARGLGHEDERGRRNMGEENASGKTDVDAKLSQVLTETRMVLPGAQALLGFQLAVTLTEGFGKLPASSKYVHLAGIAFVGLSAVVLMAPAAYHRIVEEGEATEHFHSVATRMLLGAMVLLALGLCSDAFVVTRLITKSVPFAAGFAAIALLFFYGLWFGLTLYIRAHRPRSRRAFDRVTGVPTYR